MTQLNALLKRNFLCFFKSKSKVFFTFLTPLIYLFIYFILIRKLMAGGFENIPNASKITKDALVDGFLLFGIISITTITTAVTGATQIVDDKLSGVLKDISITPIKSSTIRVSFILINWIINMIISTGLFLIAICYMLIKHTAINGWYNYLYFVPMIVLSTLFNSILFTLIFSFFKNKSVYSAFCSLFSSIIGFLIGVYIPWNSLNNNVLLQICSVIPQTQFTNVFKYLSLANISENDINFGKEALGIDYIVLFGQKINIWICILYSGCWTVVTLTVASLYKFNINK
ncbi:ABC transporter permease [Mycoplasma sp. ES3157-GEN-MYC]|nr:ABC transporter permease [Mycoplasma miroungigenitalium]MBU4691605.1 ABC transporter permease [Mycoplasma miroungigenitalium]